MTDDLRRLARKTDGDHGADASASGPARRRRLRILVLDDEPSIREFLGRVLSRAGYEPVLAATAPRPSRSCDRPARGDPLRPPDGRDERRRFHAAVAAIDPALGRRFAFMSGDVLNPELREFATARDVQLLAKPFDIAGRRDRPDPRSATPRRHGRRLSRAGSCGSRGPVFWPRCPAATRSRSTFGGAKCACRSPRTRTSMIPRQTSRPMKSASSSGPIGWFRPTFAPVSMSSACRGPPRRPASPPRGRA